MATPALGERPLPAGQRAGLAVPRIISRSGGVVGGGGLLFPDYPYDHSRSILGGSLYVDPVSGSSGNNGLSQGAAKQTIAQAISAIGTSSSKKIYLMNGTHTMVSQIDLSGISGVIGTPIEITGLPGHTPTLNINGVSQAFRVDNCQYWKFSHLTVTNWGGGPEDGAWWVSDNVGASNIMWFCLDGTTANNGDNNGMVQMYGQRSSEMDIQRCRIRFTGNGATANQNTAGIYIVRPTGTGRITIDRCDISGFPQGIYHKHGEEGRTTLSNGSVTNTLLTNANRLNFGFNPAGWVYTNCVFGTGVNEIYLAEADGGAAGDANQFFHCTFYTGLLLQNAGDGANNNKLFNCVIRNHLIIQLGSITSDSDFNAWAAGSVINGGNLAAWKLANGSDANSVQGALTFAGGADATLVNFYGLTGTVGKNVANDGTDMGANCDPLYIGVRAA